MKISFEFRKAYLIVVLALAVVLSAGYVFASLITPIRNPGHYASELQKCSDGEILKMVGGTWACDPGISSQWTNVAGGINCAGGNVGIGTTTPGQPLTVKSDAGMGLQSENSGDGGKQITFINSDGTAKSIVGRGNDNQEWTGITSLGASSWQFVVMDTGKVGIGTEVPQAKLEVYDSGTFNPADIGNGAHIAIGHINGILSSGGNWDAVGFCSGTNDPANPGTPAQIGCQGVNLVGNMYWATRNSDNKMTNLMTLYKNGNLGVNGVKLAPQTSLPACNSANNGLIVYVSGTNWVRSEGGCNYYSIEHCPNICTYYTDQNGNTVSNWIDMGNCGAIEVDDC